VEQQRAAIRSAFFTTAPAAAAAEDWVVGIHGGKWSGLSQDGMWYSGVRVVVFTAQVFLNLLRSGRWSLRRTCVLVFDECHNATKDHPYALVMRVRIVPFPPLSLCCCLCCQCAAACCRVSLCVLCSSCCWCVRA
jgi:hypothetical protein